jgi:hypothetical protein
VFKVAATALANKVLPVLEGLRSALRVVQLDGTFGSPVPGGPYNNTPLGGLIPTRYCNRLSAESLHFHNHITHLEKLRVHQW